MDDYKIINIEDNLFSNVAYLKFQPVRDVNLNFLNSNNKIIINLQLNVRDVELRYRSTFWQKLNQVWTQYFAILFVFIAIIDRVKERLFKVHFFAAWENVPWKKIY